MATWNAIVEKAWPCFISQGVKKRISKHAVELQTTEGRTRCGQRSDVYSGQHAAAFIKGHPEARRSQIPIALYLVLARSCHDGFKKKQRQSLRKFDRTGANQRRVHSRIKVGQPSDPS